MKRVFSPGTDQEWEHTLRNPQVQSALARRIREQPQGYQGGGGVDDDSGPISLQEMQAASQEASTTTDPARKQQLLAKVARYNKQQLNPPSSSSSGGGGMLSNLMQPGPTTAGNTLGGAGLGAMLGANAVRNTPGGPKGGGWQGALAGAGMGMAMNFLGRKFGKAGQLPALQNTPEQTVGSPGGMFGPQTEEDTEGAQSAAEETMGSPDGGSFDVPPPTDTGADVGSMGDLDIAMARGGEVHEDAAEDRAQTLGILSEGLRVKEKGLTKAGGGRLKFTPDRGEAPPPTKPGRSVLHRKPLGAAIPILHTTIVISPKEKAPKKVAKNPQVSKHTKKKGGAVKAKAAGPPAPFQKGGHVQVPRGYGAAQRGKGFSGIY